MSSVSSVSSTSGNLIQPKTLNSSAASSSGTTSNLGQGKSALLDSQEQILAALPTTDATLYGAAPVPSELLDNIGTSSALNAVSRINELGLTESGSPILPLGDASQAAAYGISAENNNSQTLVENLEDSSSGTSSPGLPPAYVARAYASAADLDQTSGTQINFNA